MADAINISAARFNNLKARLKQVFKNRKYYGDISAYGNTSYDFTVNPTTGDIILSEHGTKVINLILTISDVGSLKKIENNQYILQDISAIEDFVTRLEGQSPTSITNLCRGGCMGICVQHCSTACLGNCSSSCSSANCGTGCSGGCYTSCTGCSGSCSGSGCRSDCASGCQGGLR